MFYPLYVTKIITTAIQMIRVKTIKNFIYLTNLTPFHLVLILPQKIKLNPNIMILINCQKLLVKALLLSFIWTLAFSQKNIDDLEHLIEPKNTDFDIIARVKTYQRKTSTNWRLSGWSLFFSSWFILFSGWVTFKQCL